MASSIFGTFYGTGVTYTGASTIAITGALTTTGNIRASGGTVNVGANLSGIVETSSNLLLSPADGGGQLQVLTAGSGVAVNTLTIPNLLLQSGGTTRARLIAPALDTLNLTNAAGTGNPTLQVGGVSGAATFGPSAVASLTVAAGVVTAAS